MNSKKKKKVIGVFCVKSCGRHYEKIVRWDAHFFFVV